MSGKPDLAKPQLCRDEKTYYSCEVCHRGFDRRCNLTQHSRVHRDEKLFPVSSEKCSKDDQENLVRASEKPYQCRECHVTFSQKSYLKSHLSVHSTATRHYRCEICQKGFSKIHNLRSHLLIHTGKKPYKCKVCQQNFARKRNLNEHLLLHTGEKPYRCQVCPKSFTWRNSLRHHLRCHTGERPHQCEICHRRFSQKRGLNLHVRIHSRDKMHKCKICERRFYQFTAFQSHLLAHAGMKPEVCHEDFTQEARLDVRKVKHTDDDKREVRRKGFTPKTLLETHSPKHCDTEAVDTDTFRCTICCQDFCEEEQLTKHLLTHIEKCYQCSKCPRSFSVERFLKTHMHAVHKG